MPSTACFVANYRVSFGTVPDFAEWLRYLATALFDDADVMESGEEHTSKPEGCCTPSRFLPLAADFPSFSLGLVRLIFVSSEAVSGSL